MRRCDVVVVGAGPAGSTTAMLLARTGLDVVLLDRCAFPRPKPCGDCLSPNVSRLLDRIGMLDAVLAGQPARLEGWRIVSPGGFSFQTRFDELTDDPAVGSALAIARSRLDAVLFDGAAAAGADAWTGVRVTGLLRGGQGVTCTGPDGRHTELHARLTVGADGLRSIVARRAGAIRRPAKLRKVSLTAHIRGIPAGPALGEMHLAPGLCAGFAPVTSGPDVAFNLTIVADADRYGRAVAADAAAFFRSALGRFPALDSIPEHISAGIGRRDLLASGPFDVPARHVVAPGLALVGDAAGYYDPFTGQGINQAIEGALMLADEAADALRRHARSRPCLRRYASRLRSSVRGRRSVQRMIEFVLSRAGLADRAMARLAGRPAVARSLIAATGDIAPAMSVFSPAVLLALAGPAVREGRA